MTTVTAQISQCHRVLVLMQEGGSAEVEQFSSMRSMPVSPTGFVVSVSPSTQAAATLAARQARQGKVYTMEADAVEAPTGTGAGSEVPPVDVGIRQHNLNDSDSRPSIVTLLPQASAGVVAMGNQSPVDPLHRHGVTHGRTEVCVCFIRPHRMSR